MAKAGLMFSKRDEWYTPKKVVDFFGPFDYDPATTKKQAKYLGILNYDTIETNGLKQDWRRFDRIWINPPFTRKFEFLEKAMETMLWNDVKIFFLMPAETITTKKFHEIVGGAAIYSMVAEWQNKIRGWFWNKFFTSFWIGNNRIRQQICWHSNKALEALWLK